MNKYIVLSVVLFLTGSYASENPFTVDKNFQQLEQEQNSLLSELKAVAIKLEEAEDAEDEEEEEAEVPQVESAIPVPEPKTSAVPSETNNTAASEAVVVKEEEARLKKVQEDQKKLEKARLKQEKEKLALEKFAAETLAAEEAAKKIEEKRIAEELVTLKAEKQKLEKKLAAEEAAKEAAKKETLKEDKEVSARKEVDSVRKSVEPPLTQKKSAPVQVDSGVSPDPEADQMADEAFRKALLEVN